MASFRNSGLVDPKAPATVSAVGAELGMAPPYSLTTILSQGASRSFSAEITTEGMEALGGTVDLTIHSDGHYEIHLHMHDSGGISYKFYVVAIFADHDGKLLFAIHSHGEVEGTDKTIPFVHEPQREFYDNRANFDGRLRDRWYSVKDGQLTVSKSYSHAGLVGVAEGVIKGFFLEFVGVVLGGEVLPPVFGVIYLTNLFTQFSDKIKFLGESGLVGLIAAGGAFVLVGPTVMFPVFLAAGAAMELGPRHRPLRQDEKTFADTVFNGTVDLDLIIITDLVGLGGRPFTAPGMDGSIIINLGIGNYYDDVSLGVIAGATSNDPGGVKGYHFIHEMTHAWEIQNADFAAEGFLCSEGILWKDSLVDNSLTSQYKYGPAGGEWSKAFNVEQRAAIVADWFTGNWFFSNNKRTDPRIAADPADEYFKYIAGNIMVGSF